MLYVEKKYTKNKATNLQNKELGVAYTNKKEKSPISQNFTTG